MVIIWMKIIKNRFNKKDQITTSITGISHTVFDSNDVTPEI